MERIDAKTDVSGHLYLESDPQPEEGDNYYCLKAVRIDGSVEYSPVQKVEYGLTDDFGIFPNPASTQVYVYPERFLGKDVNLLIANAYGKPVFELKLNDLQEDLVKVDLGQQGIRSGVYFVSVIHRGRALTKRMVVSSMD